MSPSRRRILRDSPTRGGGCAAVKALLSPMGMARDRRCRRRIVRRRPRSRKVETQRDDEVAEAQGDSLVGDTGRVMLSVRACACQTPVKVGIGEGGAAAIGWVARRDGSES